MNRALENADVELGIVVALGMEAGGLEDRLAGLIAVRAGRFRVRRGLLARRSTAVIISGAGEERAADATEALIDAHRPRRIVSAGFCGGLHDALGTHDILLADRIVRAADDAVEIAINLSAMPAALRNARGVHVGRLLTVGRVICQREEKLALGQQFAALGVDMESAAVAAVCQRRGTPLWVVRAVSDRVDEQLPPDMQRLLMQRSMAAQWGAALSAIACRPRSALDLYRLKENALVTSDRLAVFLEDLARSLGPPNDSSP